MKKTFLNFSKFLFIVLSLFYSCNEDEPKSKGKKEIEKCLEEVKKELGENFIYATSEDIFVIASNANKQNTDRAILTIKHVYNAMYKFFFTKKPTKPLKVYLFKDGKSYEKYVVEKYKQKPSTPFGFYLSSERKMIMNIATGTGTLAHELVHPLLEEDFENVPPWFNEGFASLFEQSMHQEDGSMKGLVNWRLPALQKAITKKQITPLKEILSMSRDDFYEENSGLNYAQARYLCLFLQEKDLLVKFYKKIKELSEKDKTGIKAIEEVYKKNIDKLQKDWEEWVSTLEFNE